MTSMRTSSSAPAPADAGVNSILVIGAPRVGKRFIVQKLVTPRAAAAEAAVAPADAVPHSTLPHSGIHAFNCSIDTKYYSAPLTFHVLPAATHAQFSGEEHDATTGDDAAAPLSAEARSEFRSLDVQAVLLVFDLTSAASFHTLAARWLPFIEERDPGVLLCVGNETGSAVALTAAQQQDLDELDQLARDWALDHGMEYVRVPHNDSLAGARTALGMSATNSEELEASAEPAGVSRLLEALECNMWTHSTMKDRRLAHIQGREAATAKASGPRSSDEYEDDDDESQSAFADMQQQQEEQEIKEKERAEDDSAQTDSFTEFVSAFPHFVAPTQQQANSATTATATSSTPSASASVPVSSSSSSSSASSSKSATTAGSAARSASASAFANAFARAIRSDDAPATKKASSSTKAAAKATTGTPAAAAATTAPVADALATDAPLTAAEMDALSAQLLASVQSDASASSAASAATAADDDEKDDSDAALEKEMGAFDAVFDKLSGIKAEAARAREAGINGGMSDADRRRKAEETIMRLMQSMGMQDELDDDDDEDDEKASTAD